MRKRAWIFLLFSSLVLFMMLPTSSHKTHRLEEALGPHVINKIETSQQVLAGRAVKSDLHRFALSKQQHVLVSDSVKKLRRLLLNDRAYFFDKSKKCLFTPEMAFQIDSQDPVYLFVNLFCHQLKFKHKELEVILDYDPIGPEFETFCRELLEHLDGVRAL